MLLKSLNIALIGYGKMGKIIEEIATKRGHIISFIANSENADFTIEDLKKSKSDVAIEFSLPHFAVNNIKKCIDANIPVAIGTTGWYEHLEEVRNYSIENGGCILPTTNFSIGVNIFFNVNERLAELMNPHTTYETEITEIHHTQKLDAPSGTAITTAEIILKQLDRKTNWVKEKATHPNELVIKSIRTENVPGTHEVVYENDIDNITLIHTAKNRKGFAYGAVIAIEFLYSKKGIYSMKDVLGLKIF
jgi:4-hydroxy-tetrahydrodipicolinate reductase